MPKASMKEDDWFPLQIEIEQLFTGSPVAEEDLFAGRIPEVRRLLEAVFDPSKHVILHGERGVGKTSIANVFWRRYNANLQTFVVARVQADPSDDFGTLWNKAIEELTHIARSMGKHELVPLDDTVDIKTVDNVRRELQKCRPNSIPVIIIDEFDKLKNSHARELCSNLVKSLYDYSVHATIVLVGVAEDVARLVHDHQSLGRALVQIKLDRMGDKELNEVIDKRLSKTVMRIDGDARWTIVTMSRGLPYFTQMLCKYAAIAAIDQRSITIQTEHVEKAMDRFIQESDQTFIDSYELATASPQADNLFRQVILACALAQSDSSGFFTPTNVIEPLTGVLGRKVTHSHFSRHLSEFISKGRGEILNRKGYERNYRFRFTDPMMQPYVIIKGIRDGMIPDAAKKTLLQREQPSFLIDED